MPSKVFISYRRSDSAWSSAAIHAVLTEQLGAENVFKDMESIKPGMPWLEAVTEALDASEATFVIIGPTWTTCSVESQSEPRLKLPDDLVRLEVAQSLDRDVPVVPVLIDDTPLPTVGELPEDVSGLLDRQAARISSLHYKEDMGNLVRRLGLQTVSSEVSSELPVAPAQETHTGLLLRFLQTYHQWAFSPLRIRRWGSEQLGFERLKDWTTEETRGALEELAQSHSIRTQMSKKGNQIYRAQKPIAS